MKKFSSVLSILLIVFLVWYTLYSYAPSSISDLNTPKEQFSTLRALQHVKNISKKPHYVGSPAHASVKNYILQELKGLGLDPEIQEGFSVGKTGSCARVQNIIARIRGTGSGKGLMLLSHYDSATHTSYGASDAASGVAVILEGIRAFLASGDIPKNDIIICITDGEELGLNGADYFVKHHPWVDRIGMVLNFEARGSGGHSFMLIETNSKNSKLINHFQKAKPSFPVANSLAYSIYKIMPNDTDLTVFREHADIEGFNFAFIDDHFDYHTSNDTWENLDLSTLEHQGSYLTALLPYFSQLELQNLKSQSDNNYFNFPVLGTITYPFSWNIPLLIIAIVLLTIVVFYGKTQYRIRSKEVVKGISSLGLSLLLSFLMDFGGWKLLTILYPQYLEMQHGFTYNGHLYVAAFVVLSIAICFKVYSKTYQKDNQPSLFFSVLLCWWLICLLSCMYLKGASYLIVLVIFGIISLFVLIRQKKPPIFLNILLCFPAIYIIVPFIHDFPVALGLRILFISGILTVFLFGLLLPVFGFLKKKSTLGNLLFLVGFILLIVAHFQSGFTKTRQKPNSLVYIYDEDTKQSVWATYDKLLDEWTKNYIKKNEDISEDYTKDMLENKYGIKFSFVNKAPKKQMFTPIIEIKKDTIDGAYRKLTLCIAAQRTINRLDLFTKTIFNFKKLTVNGASASDFTYNNGETYNAFTKRWDRKLLTHYVTNNEALEIEMTFTKDSVPKFVLYESSYDLLTNPQFSIPEREKHMMPKPFLINDAIIYRKSFTLENLNSNNSSFDLKTNAINSL